MSDAPVLALAWMAGVALGAIYFGGLWWTVRRGLASRRPALWMGSLLLRVGVVLAGFYFIGQGHWQRLVACLLGFVMARLAATWWMRPPGQKQACESGEASHAP